MRKIYLIIALFPFFSISFFAQNQPQTKLDLLKIKLSKEIVIDSIFKINNQIAIELKNNSYVDEAIQLLHKNIKLGKKNNKEIGIVASYITLTNIYIYSSVLDSASYFNSKAIEVSKKNNNKNKLAIAYMQKSVIYQSKSDFKNQLKYILLSLEISKDINDPFIISQNYNSLTMYFLDQNKYKEALNAAKNANKYALLSKNEQVITNSYTGLAESYSLLNDTINAEINFKKGINLAKRSNNKLAIAWFLTNFSKLKKDKEALNMRFEAQKILDEIGINPLNVNNTGMIGVILFKMYEIEKDKLKQKNYLDNAEKYLTKTILNSDENSDIVNSIEFNYVLAKLYSIKKQYEKAYFFHAKSSRLNDSLNSQENKNSLAKLESQKEIELRDKEIKINKLSLEAKEKQKWLYVAGIGFLAIIGGLLFYQSRKRRLTNLKLETLNKNLDTKNLELDQANQAKTRFFGILNHDLRGPVNNLVIFLQLQQEAPEMLDEESTKRMQDKTMTGAKNLLSSMEDILQWSKSQMENFKPQPKNVLVQQLFDDTKKVFSGYLNIKIEYNNPENIEIFTDENYLKTIIRNLTSNAINIFVSSSAVEKQIIWKAWKENSISYLSITDNGHGATPEKFKALFDGSEITGTKSGLGLHLIRDMAKSINCEISVESTIGKGTTFTLRL